MRENAHRRIPRRRGTTHTALQGTRLMQACEAKLRVERCDNNSEEISF
jgi:hypothetical protein